MIRSDTNLGVTRGRNLLAEAATGDVLVFLDDDAVFLSRVCDLLADLAADPSLGAVAFRVHRPGRSETSLEHPFRGSGLRGRSDARPCSYFVGCGYTIRHLAHLDAGGYDDRFFYSTEEVDLSFRILHDGWTLRYQPGIEVEHRPSPPGPGRFLGRTGVAAPESPPPGPSPPAAPLAVVHVTIWAARTGREALREGSPAAWWKLAREGLRLPVERRALGWGLLLRSTAWEDVSSTDPGSPCAAGNGDSSPVQNPADQVH